MRNFPVFDSARATTYIQVAKIFEDTGNCSGLGWAIQNFSWAIHRYGSTEEKAELAKLRVRFGEWYAYEKEHGKGSLLKKDHPENIRFAEIMRQIAESKNSPLQVTAAPPV
jgi:hypothetical protein